MHIPDAVSQGQRSTRSTGYNTLADVGCYIRICMYFVQWRMERKGAMLATTSPSTTYETCLPRVLGRFFKLFSSAYGASSSRTGSRVKTKLWVDITTRLFCPRLCYESFMLSIDIAVSNLIWSFHRSMSYLLQLCGRHKVWPLGTRNFQSGTHTMSTGQ